jgi:hypothetical protein
MISTGEPHANVRECLLSIHVELPNTDEQIIVGIGLGVLIWVGS